MKNLFIYLFTTIIPAFSIVFVPAYAQEDKIHVCHEGHVIEISINDLAAHQLHGDEIAVKNADDEWVCPQDTTEPCEPGSPPTDCPDKTECCWQYNFTACQWEKVDCPECINPWTKLPCECEDANGVAIPCPHPPGVPGIDICWNPINLQWEECCRDKKGNTYPCLKKDK